MSGTHQPKSITNSQAVNAIAPNDVASAQENDCWQEEQEADSANLTTLPEKLVQKRVAQLERENADLRRKLAHSQLDIAELQETQQALRVREEAERQVLLREKVATERVAELAKANQALQASLSKLADEPELKRFLGHILIVYAEQFGAIGAGIWQYEDELSYLLASYEDDTIHLPSEFAHPDAPCYLKQMREDPDVYTRLTSGEIVTHTEEDLQTRSIYQPYQADLQQRGIRSLLLIPICLGQSLRGSLVLRFDRRYILKAEAAELAHALANQAALALELTRLAEEVQQATILEERNRMAREIHDTLAQAFTGIVVHQQAIQQLLTTNPVAPSLPWQDHLDWTIALAREGLQAARRSVYALRCETVQQENLQTALQRLVKQMTHSSSAETIVSVRGTPYPLSEILTRDLFRIGQEALTNAVKHATAQQIHIELIYEPTQVRLRVQDDGQGFRLHLSAQSAPSGFGLIGMQERADRLGGQLFITSQPTKGTEVAIAVPMNQAE